MPNQFTGPTDAATRFWPKVDNSGGPDACWPWLAGRFPKTGYGAFWLNGANHHAHRIAFLLTFGQLPDEVVVRHLICDNPPCCNPTHLAKGTHADNVEDRVKKGRSARGATSGFAKHPERWSRGDAHYSRIRPDLLARGDRNGARTKPEAKPRGEAHRNAKLTDDAVRAIRAALDTGEQGKSLATRFGVGETTISNIKAGRIWKHVISYSDSSR